jgi:hypothetical protein
MDKLTCIVRKVLAIQPDLVMKSASGTHPLRLFTLDSKRLAAHARMPGNAHAGSRQSLG